MPRLPLPSGADVVIVGGGVVGVSAAFHLAEAGAEVVLLERDQLASGSTSKAAGGLRAQFSDALNIEIAKRSLEAYKQFEQRPGWEIDYEEIGYLFVLTTETELDAFTRSVALQNELGVPSRIITPDEARELCPLIAGEDILAASYCPTDAHATPESVVQGYASVRAGTARTSPCRRRSRGSTCVDGVIKGVHTPHGVVETGTVICAAGAWSRTCGEMVGVQLDVTPLRRQVLFTAPMADLPAKLPLTIDFATGFYFHREGRGLLTGMADPNETPGFLTETTDDWIPALLEIAERRAPRIASAPDPGRLGRPLRHEPGPQRDDRRGQERLALPVRHRVLRPRLPARPRRPARSCATSSSDATPFVDVTPMSADRFDGGMLAPEFHVV